MQPLCYEVIFFGLMGIGPLAKILGWFDFVALSTRSHFIVSIFLVMKETKFARLKEEAIDCREKVIPKLVKLAGGDFIQKPTCS